MCYGADMVEILALGLRRTLGTNSAQAVAPEVVRSCLRLAYHWADLNDSRLGRDLRAWEANNPEFRVFGDADYESEPNAGVGTDPTAGSEVRKATHDRGFRSHSKPGGHQ